MNQSKSIIGRVGMLVACLLITLPALAVIPVRGSSRNGDNGSAAFWNALGPGNGTRQGVFGRDS